MTTMWLVRGALRQLAGALDERAAEPPRTTLVTPAPRPPRPGKAAAASSQVD